MATSNGAHPPIITSIWGPEKTGKSSLGMTFPPRIEVFDFDLGYDRAAYRFHREEESGLLVCHSYPAPLNITVQRNQPLQGYKELWYRFLTDFMSALTDDAVHTLMIDTATQCWQICHMAFLQEKQEAQLPLDARGKDAKGNTLRESLIPIEYAEPNARMRAVVQAGKGYHKNLVITHYQGAVYSKRMNGDRVEDYDTGEKQLDGFKQTAGLSDIVLRTRVEGVTPKAVVTLCGLSLNLVGIELVNPTYDSIMGALDSLRSV